MGHLLALHRKGEETPGPGPEGPIRTHGAGGVEGRMGQARPVDRLHGPLGLEVVGVEGGLHLRGIA